MLIKKYHICILMYINKVFSYVFKVIYSLTFKVWKEMYLFGFLFIHTPTHFAFGQIVYDQDMVHKSILKYELEGSGKSGQNKRSQNNWENQMWGDKKEIMLGIVSH